MGIQKEIEKRIRKKEDELSRRREEWLRDEAAGKAYIQGLQDVLKSLPRDDQEHVSPASIMRPGSAMAKTRQLILKAGRPLRIEEVLEGLGRNVSKKTRASVGGALGTYVRKGEVFVRTAPGTFGLKELGHREESPTDESEPPEGFGQVDEEEEIGQEKGGWGELAEG